MSAQRWATAALTALVPTAASAQADAQLVYPASVTLIPNPRTDVTHTRDVAPIIQENCVKCRRPRTFDMQCCWTNGYVEVEVTR